MIKKFTYTLLALAITVIFVRAGITSYPKPSFGYTGATLNSTCANSGCHTNTVKNTGSVSIIGLPTNNGYVPDSVYNFSLTITSDQPGLQRWGFAIVARNNLNKKIGTFMEDNLNTIVDKRVDMSGNEIDQQLVDSAPGLVAVGTSYTYNNLKWKAPSIEQATNDPIKFFFAAVAADGNGSRTGDFVYTGRTETVLPITLSKISTAVNGEVVNLTWQTSSESNSSYFIIEKSTDNRNFISVGTVNAAGTSSGLRNYSYTDDKPAYFDKSTFYRLILVDKDGTKKYSGVVSVIVKAKGSFVRKIYPNPVIAGDNMQVELVANKDQSVNIELISIKGRKVKQLQSQLTKGNNLLNLRLFKYTPSGMYVVVVRMENVTQQIPILIQ